MSILSNIRNKEQYKELIRIYNDRLQYLPDKNVEKEEFQQNLNIFLKQDVPDILVIIKNDHYHHESCYVVNKWSEGTYRQRLRDTDKMPGLCCTVERLEIDTTFVSMLPDVKQTVNLYQYAMWRRRPLIKIKNLGQTYNVVIDTGAIECFMFYPHEISDCFVPDDSIIPQTLAGQRYDKAFKESILVDRLEHRVTIYYGPKPQNVESEIQGIIGMEFLLNVNVFISAGKITICDN